MTSKFLLVAAALCVSGICAEQVLPRQSPSLLTPVADPSPGPEASGKPTPTTITVTAVVTSTEVETNFVTVVNTVINNVTVEVTETETDLQTLFVTGFVTTSVTNLVTDIETEVVTNVKTLPAVTETQLITNVETLPALTKTEVLTNFKTLPAVTETQKVTLPAVTVQKTVTLAKPALTVTKTVVETATNPLSTLCPGGSEEVFEAERGVFIIVCGQSRPTFDLIPGGQSTDSVYDCAVLCDSLTAAGVECSAGIFEADTSICSPQGVDDSSSLVSAPGFDTAVLNTTAVANSLNQAKLKKRSAWLF